MTKPYHQTITCPHCSEEITTETSFGRFIRSHPDLESRQGHVFYDLDVTSCRYICHRFKVDYRRDIQFLMCIEIKTHGADVDAAQHDTLNLFGQVLRNRKRTPNKKRIAYQLDQTRNEAHSCISGKKITLRLYGLHLLQFSGAGPEDSAEIKWDRKVISKDDLVKLLKFELDPDTLKEVDLRIHHETKTLELLFPPER